MTPEAQVTALAILIGAVVAVFWWFITRIETSETDRGAREPQACPFCGGPARVNGTADLGFYVCCDNARCMLMGPYAPTAPEAVTGWNRIEVMG